METDLRQEVPRETIQGMVSGRKEGRRAEEWVRLFQRRVLELAQSRVMTGTHWRVLMYLVARATFAQDITVRQRDIAQGVGIKQPTVSRVLHDLDGLGVVLRVETGGYPATYRLNAQYMYKGRGERLEQRRAYQGKERSRG